MITALEFIDKNGLIKPRRAWSDSGNGLLYTVLCNLLCSGGISPVTQLYKLSLGVLWRTPTNDYGQESVDDYLAYSVWLLHLDAKELAKHLLWSSIKKFGFMQNSFNKGDFVRSFLWRFPTPWCVLAAAAYSNSNTPILHWVLSFPVRVIAMTQKLDTTNASATQLHWLQLRALEMMGHPESMRRFQAELKAQRTSMSAIMKDYYDEGHPILEGFRALESGRTFP